MSSGRWRASLDLRFPPLLRKDGAPGVREFRSRPVQDDNGLRLSAIVSVMCKSHVDGVGDSGHSRSKRGGELLLYVLPV